MLHVTCLDFEGVLIPEIWIGLARHTGIKELSLTTRDIEDYDELMRHRLNLCELNGITLKDVHHVVAGFEPLDGALSFLRWLRVHSEVILLSDTFREFVVPVMHKLEHPTLLCHSLLIDDDQNILDYRLRIQDQKRRAVRAFQEMNFKVAGIGDSYNDIPMLQEAHHGILFRPSEKVVQDYPMFPVMWQYSDLKLRLKEILVPCNTC